MDGFALADSSFTFPEKVRGVNFYSALRHSPSSPQHQWRFQALWLKRLHPTPIAEYRRANLQPDMPAWTARTTADIQKRQAELKRPVSMASAASGGAGMKAAPAPGILKKTVQAVQAAVKGMFSAVAGAVSSRATNPDEAMEEEDSLMLAMRDNQYKRPDPVMGSSEDFRKTLNGKLVYGG